MKKKIEKVLEEIRPHLKADGGDVELVGVDEKKGIVKVRLKGACVGCPYSLITLEQGIGNTLKKKVKGVKEIKSVD